MLTDTISTPKLLLLKCQKLLVLLFTGNYDTTKSAVNLPDVICVLLTLRRDQAYCFSKFCNFWLKSNLYLTDGLSLAVLSLILGTCLLLNHMVKGRRMLGVIVAYLIVYTTSSISIA